MFGIPYEWAEMPRWYIIAGQVSSIEVIRLSTYRYFSVLHNYSITGEHLGPSSGFIYRAAASLDLQCSTKQKL